MSWLRKRAAELAACAYDDRAGTDPRRAEHIEQLAKEYAERAASEAYREGIKQGERSASAYEHGHRCTPTDEKEAVDEALAAADKET